MSFRAPFFPSRACKRGPGGPRLTLLSTLRAREWGREGRVRHGDDHPTVRLDRPVGAELDAIHWRLVVETVAVGPPEDHADTSGKNGPALPVPQTEEEAGAAAPGSGSAPAGGGDVWGDAAKVLADADLLLVLDTCSAVQLDRIAPAVATSDTEGVDLSASYSR